MILFLPVSTYRLQFQVANGRPFGKLEKLILRAIQKDGCTNLEALKTTFLLHERLLMEALVSLFYSGHLGVDGNRLVCISALQPDVAPASSNEQAEAAPETLDTRTVTAALVQERVTGQLLREDAGRFFRLKTLEREGKLAQGFIIPSADLPPSVDSGQVVPLLQVLSGSYLRDIGPVYANRAGQDVMVVTANLASGEIHNLPVDWQAGLADTLRLYAQHFQRSMERSDPRLHTAGWAEEKKSTFSGKSGSSDHQKESRVSIPVFEVRKEHLSLIAGRDDHQTALRELLTNAKSQVLLLTPNLQVEVVAEIEPLLRAALLRGVNIDVLWGREPASEAADSHRTGLELLKRIEYDSRVRAGGARLLVSRKRSHIRASIAAGDPEGEPAVILGTYDFLGTQLNEHLNTVSVRLTASGPVALLFRVFADFCTDDTDLRNSSAASWLRYHAEQLDRIRATQYASAHRERLEDAAPRTDEVGVEASSDLTDDLPGEIDEGPNSDVVAEDDASSLGHEEDLLRVRVLIDRQHEDALKQAADGATHNFSLGSQCVTGPGIHGRLGKLQSVLEHGRAKVRIYYAQSDLTADERGRLSEQVEKRGGEVTEATALGAGFVAQDTDLLVITCHDWLNAYPKPERPYGMDIGFEIQGSGMATLGLSKLNILT